jgi:hypothetical protein
LFGARQWLSFFKASTPAPDINGLGGQVATFSRRCIHFIGFRGEEYWSAVKVWGAPDYFHMGWDRRAAREIRDGDVLIFATGSDADEPRARSWPDIIEEMENGI